NTTTCSSSRPSRFTTGSARWTLIWAAIDGSRTTKTWNKGCTRVRTARLAWSILAGGNHRAEPVLNASDTVGGGFKSAFARSLWWRSSSHFAAPRLPYEKAAARYLLGSWV